VRRLVAILISILAWASFGSAYAGPPYPLRENLNFDANSRLALVVFEAEPNTAGPPWLLDLLQFDPQTRTWTYGMMRGWSHFEAIGPGASGRQFYAGLVDPGGVYAINNIAAASYWHACFNGGTESFTLQAGAVNYLGLIDPNPTILDIMHTLPNETHGKHLFIFDTPRLAYTPASERPNWEADVTAYVASHFPRVHVSVVAPEPTAVTFERGHSMLGDICEKY
jgi:hypothetical protein